jgi:hypothetical protein
MAGQYEVDPQPEPEGLMTTLWKSRHLPEETTPKAGKFQKLTGETPANIWSAYSAASSL